MNKKILSSVAGLVIGATALIGSAASPAAASSGCKVTSSNHSVSLTCGAGETRTGVFRVVAYFCSTSRCQNISGPLVKLGRTSTVTNNGGYYSGEWTMTDF